MFEITKSIVETIDVYVEFFKTYVELSIFITE